MKNFFGPTVVPMGQQWLSIIPASGVVTTLIAPASNINGIIIRTLGVAISNTSGVSGVIIYANTVAPSSVSDFTSRVIFQTSLSGTTDVSATAPYPIYIYPGIGLWAGSNAGGTNVFITYDQVPISLE